MTNKPESAAVEAVAWLVTNGGECCEPWLVYERSEVEALPASCIADPLYPQSALDALRGEVAMLRDALHIETHKVITCGVAASHPDASLSRRMEYAGKWDSPQAQEVRALRDKADAAERRVAELHGVLSDAVGSLYRMDVTKLNAGDKHTLDVLLDRLQTAITLRQEKPE